MLNGFGLYVSVVIKSPLVLLNTIDSNKSPYLPENDDLDLKHERINSKLAKQSVDSEIREFSRIDAENDKSLLKPSQQSEDYNPLK